MDWLCMMCLNFSHNEGFIALPFMSSLMSNLVCLLAFRFGLGRVVYSGFLVSADGIRLTISGWFLYVKKEDDSVFLFHLYLMLKYGLKET